jgi:predicted dehydrogenase
MSKRETGFAIIGTGMISKFHARAIREVPGARLVAVCGRERAKAEAFAAEFRCTAFDSLDALLACPGVDVVTVTTPSGAHLDASVAAAKAGKHVLCEKPLEITLERVDAMIAAHRQAGTRLGCTFQLRYMPALQPIRDALREGRFGTITYAGVYVPWWRTDEYYSGSPWHGKLALDGGGALMNQAIHMIDLLCDLLPPVEAVSAFTSSVGHPGIETEDAAAATLRFQGGAVGVIYGTTSSWPGQAKRLEITGTNGTAVLVEDALAVFEFRDKRAEDAALLARHGRSGGAHGVSDPAAMTHALHAVCFRDFVACIETGQRFPVDGEAARKSVAIVRAIYESAASGRAVSVPMTKGRV